jgi:23S rRNA (cytidine1920-2'-O)/16S rRNA (cytidine1409-2'-O)-methyltransferase
MALASPGAQMIALIKPQFELGPEKIGKGGIVKADEEDLEALPRDIAAWLNAAGWPLIGIIDSPIAGGDGNKEFLIGAVKSA